MNDSELSSLILVLLNDYLGYYVPEMGRAPVTFSQGFPKAMGIEAYKLGIVYHIFKA